MASASSLPAGGMWRAAPVKAAKISRGELSQYRSNSVLNGGGRPLAIARAIRLACSSVGGDFDWTRLFTFPQRAPQLQGRLVGIFALQLSCYHQARRRGVVAGEVLGLKPRQHG